MTLTLTANGYDYQFSESFLGNVWMYFRTAGTDNKFQPSTKKFNTLDEARAWVEEVKETIEARKNRKESTLDCSRYYEEGCGHTYFGD